MRCPGVLEVMGFIPVVIVKLLFNALIKSVFEYCCSVWGNAPNDQLLRILRVQKRCSRLKLDASFHDNSVQLFKKLHWMPIDDEIRMKKLCMMFKIVNGEWPHYFTCLKTPILIVLELLFMIIWRCRSVVATKAYEHFMQMPLICGTV